MNENHTPGPWGLIVRDHFRLALPNDPHDLVRVDFKGSNGCCVIRGINLESNPIMTMDDAKLISMAPELFSVLKYWVDYCDQVEGKEASRTSAEHMEEIRKKARTVIAKIVNQEEE